MRRIQALALALPLVAGCGGTEPMNTTPKTFTEVKALVFKPSCNFSSCHNAGSKAGGLDLETDPYSALVGKDAVLPAAKSEGLKLVTASDSAKSFLYIKMALPTAVDAKYGTRMPQTGMPPEKAQLDAIKSWIDDGAKNN